MKKIFFGLLAFAVLSARAQTAGEIVQKYANAMGGLENFNKIKTIKMSGTVATQGMNLPITIQIINGKAMRSDVEVMGQSVTNAYKDGKGWKINPFAGAASATDATATELSDMKNQSFLANQLMDYKSRGSKVELEGQEDINGSKAYKIKLTDSDNKVTIYDIDPTTFLAVKVVGKRDIMGQETEIETYLTEPKEFGGVKFNTAITQKIGGQTFQEIHLDKFEVNVPIDEKIFDKQ
ncbi:MAG: outer membrane lipoprotein-sorting protein [Bacteroidetes bacterium]|nr:MAG: outer membrane lipoprotein-sorting protein [Bacteroidota bacterium]